MKKLLILERMLALFNKGCYNKCIREALKLFA